MSPRLADALVVGTSAAVLVLEILAVRLLAPYVGVTLETYTTIIGVVLAGIAVGAAFGGRLADRVPPRRTLGPLVLVGGLAALAVVPAVRAFGAASEGSGAAAIVLLALLSLLPCAAVLSAVPPTVVKLQLEDLGETGAVVGRVSALSTAGALAGTFLTGFVLVAVLPVRTIVLAVGGLLVLAGALLWLRLGRPPGRSLAGGAGAALGLAGLGLALGTPCDVASAYFCARVEPDPARASGRTLVMDTLRHSYVDLDDPAHLEFPYVRRIAEAVDALAPRGEPIAAVHLGGGGFTLPRYVEATRPGSRSRVLELDPALVELGRERLGLRTSAALQVRTGDARTSLREEPTASADLVVGDAFGGLAVPWHLTTAELVADVRRVLRPGGIYALNVIDRPPSDFARAQAATLLAAFPHVALAGPDGLLQGEVGGNFVLLASERPLPLARLRAAAADDPAEPSLVAGRPQLERFAAGAEVLTDDFAPVDQLLTPLG
jgi:SAM-dependent methyltransferase